MTEETPTNPVPLTELEVLKTRARMMGITFSNNIGLDALKAKVAAVQEGESTPAEQSDTPDLETGATMEVNALDPYAEPEIDLSKLTPAQRKAHLRHKAHLENMRLIRIRVTCMNPAKKDLHGEIFTVANGYLGTIRKFVPFGEATEEGFHVPNVIFKAMQRRQFQNLSRKKGPNGGSVQSSMVKEFAIEVLPPLTEHELAQLANAQLAAGSID